jgi:sugar phosphate isomerase/epimerase
MQLGAPLTISKTQSLDARIQACKRAGFTRIQFNLSADISGSIGGALKHCADEGMDVVAIGCYGNPLQPAVRGPLGICADDVFALLDELPTRDKSWQVVMWSGTLSGNQHASHPGNRSPGVVKELLHWSRKASMAMGSKNARLLYKPHSAHVLGSTFEAEDFMLELNSERVGLALDPCNFLSPRNFHEREKNIVEAIEILAPYAGLAVLKDARIEQFSIGYTMPGQGQIGYAGLLRHLQKNCPNIPWMIECPESEQHLRTARAYVELQAKLAGVDMGHRS